MSYRKKPFAIAVAGASVLACEMLMLTVAKHATFYDLDGCSDFSGFDGPGRIRFTGVK